MRKGIILAGGKGTRLYPLTKVTSKQLLPIYDKPMIYYPIATLMQADIRELLLISGPEDLSSYKELLGDGKPMGISINYQVQENPDGLAQAFVLAEDFLQGESSALILGDNLFYGDTFSKKLSEISMSEGASIFGYRVLDPSSYGVVEFDIHGKALSIEEKPKNPKSKFAIPGLYFFDSNASRYSKTIKPSKRGELEITDLIQIYLDRQELTVYEMDRGTAWLDTGTKDDLLSAGNFISTIEKRQGLKVNCPEEIAYNRGWLTANELEKAAESYNKSGYGDYLLNLIHN